MDVIFKYIFHSSTSLTELLLNFTDMYTAGQYDVSQVLDAWIRSLLDDLGT